MKLQSICRLEIGVSLPVHSVHYNARMWCARVNRNLIAKTTPLLANAPFLCLFLLFFFSRLSYRNALVSFEKGAVGGVDMQPVVVIVSAECGVFVEMRRLRFEAIFPAEKM